MSEEIQKTEESAAQTNDVAPDAETPDASDQSAAVEMRRPDFEPVNDTGSPPANASINRFFDVQVTVSAELGRVTIPIGDLVELGEGSVVELNRSVSSPIDLMAQGVRVATGEVVVIDDCFAVRIKSIDTIDAKKAS